MFLVAQLHLALKLDLLSIIYYEVIHMYINNFTTDVSFNPEKERLVYHKLLNCLERQNNNGFSPTNDESKVRVTILIQILYANFQS